MKEKLKFNFELKSVSGRTIEGHGSVFGNRDHGDDIVMPGAFAKTLKNYKRLGTMPLMFWMHDPKQVPGMWTEMYEDEKGLVVKGEFVDTPLGNEVRTLVERKAVRGLSIGYQTIDDEFKGDVRMIKEVDLWEVSVVSLAMNPMAQVESVKTRVSRDGEYVPTTREFERLLRDAGVATKARKTIIARVCQDDLELRDVGAVDDDADVQRLLKDLASKFRRR